MKCRVYTMIASQPLLLKSCNQGAIHLLCRIISCEFLYVYYKNLDYIHALNAVGSLTHFLVDSFQACTCIYPLKSSHFFTSFIKRGNQIFIVCYQESQCQCYYSNLLKKRVHISTELVVQVTQTHRLRNSKKC